MLGKADVVAALGFTMGKSNSWGCQVPVLQLQAGHPAELCGIGGDQRKTGKAGMAGQQDVVRADRTALGFEKRANAPGFRAASPSNTSSLIVASNNSTLDSIRRVGTLFDPGE